MKTPGSDQFFLRLNLILHFFVFAEMILQKQHELVSEAEEIGMSFLGLYRTSPRTMFFQFGFEFIKDFLNVLAVLVKQDQSPSW